MIKECLPITVGYKIKEYLPKVEIKLLKISHVRILCLVPLLFVAVINAHSAIKFLIFKYSSLFIFIVTF